MSKESMARVKDTVEHGKLLPASATRDELRAYNKLASKLTQQARQRRLELEKQERVATEPKINRMPPPRDDSPDHGSPLRNKLKFSNLRRTDKKRVVRKLDDNFKLEEEDDEEEPLTPAEALISARDYLSRAQKNRQNRPDRNTSIALQIMKDAIAASTPKKSSARRPTHERTPDRDPSSPDDDDSSDDWRKRSGKNMKHDSDDNDNRHRSSRRDARDDITQNKVNRSRRRRAAREEYSDEEASDEEIEPCGALCFTRAIRETRMPNGFKLNSTTLKYNGLEEPEAWLDDYLTVVKFRKVTNVTAMQYVQLMLESSTRHWLMNLRRGSISSWSQFQGAFIENFKSTYKRPASLEELRACKQGTREALRAYIQRWTILKNSAEDISDESAIDAFRRCL